MDCAVKAAMLKSSQAMAINLPTTPSLTHRTAQLRQTRSSDSLGSPRSFKSSTEFDTLVPPLTAGFASPHHSSSIGSSSTPRIPNGHTRGTSYHVPRTDSRSMAPLFLGESTSGKLTKEKAPGSAKNISPTRFFSILSGTSSTQLDVENIKKLRLLLRNESAR